MNGSFYEQLGGVAGLFDQWSACERTVVACALARRVPWPGLRLLQRAVEAALRQHNAASDERLERDANDEHCLAALLAPALPSDAADDEKRLHKLLSLLPLLRTDNVAGKEAWVAGAGALVQRLVDRAPPPSAAAPAAAACELARQLLTYLLVHPALTLADQRTVSQWLRYLESVMAGGRGEAAWAREPALLADTNNIWASAAPFRRTVGKNLFRTLPGEHSSFTADLQESFSKNGRDVDITIDTDRLIFDAAISQPKSQRSNSLTPPSTNFLQMSSSAENLSDEPFVQKPRSFSLSSEHSLSQLRPLSVMYGAGSETRLDELRAHPSSSSSSHPGMAHVAHWLKSLRLHKYVWLFTNITYEQMMAIDDTYLENLGVTKGARHKILLSIKKLSERGATLDALERELAAGALPPGGLLRALERLRAVLLSPLPPGGDLPPRLVRVLQLASKCLETAGGASGARPAGADDEPTPLALHCWLVEKALHHEALSAGGLRAALVALRHRLPPRQFYRHVGDMPPHRHHHHNRWRSVGGGGGWSGGRRGSAGWASGPAVPRGKSHSYPPSAPTHHQPLDYAGLDALCLQMTHHAID